MLKQYYNHLKTITKHKMIVMKLCFKCGYFKRGLLHDLSKYGPTEFIASAKHFQGTRSPIDAEKEELGYSLAWQHHQNHNPHHWEYWIDYNNNGEPVAVKIPYEYVVEMVCDWVGAGIVYSKTKCDFNIPYVEPIEYYFNHLKGRHFHHQTQGLIEIFLTVIRNHGVNSFCKIATKNSIFKTDYETNQIHY